MHVRTLVIIDEYEIPISVFIGMYNKNSAW
jgi:hypothetical protein